MQFMVQLVATKKYYGLRNAGPTNDTLSLRIIMTVSRLN